MGTVKIFSPRQAGEKMGLTHHEVIRRIHRGDIDASKLDWTWVIQESAIEAAMKSEWYQRRLKKLTASA